MPFDLKWLYGNKQYSAGLISFYNIYQVSKSRDLYLSTPENDWTKLAHSTS